MKTISSILKNESLAHFLRTCSCAYFEKTQNISAFAKFSERVLGLKPAPFHLEWVNLFYNNRRTCITAFRGSGKTTMLGVAFPLWICMFKKDIVFLIVSANMRESTKIVNAIRNFIYGNELLSVLRPESKEFVWSKVELHTTTNCKIVCRPYTLNVRGLHVDYLLADEASLYQDLSIFFGSIMPMVDHKDGHIMVIGTPQSETDLIHKLKEKEYNFTHRTCKIIENNLPTWEAKFPLEKIQRIRNELGISDFTREYLCELIAQEQQIFTPNMIAKSLDHSISFEEYYDLNSDYYIGADLAISPVGDYTVFTVVKKIDDKYIISNIYRNRGLDYNLQVSTLSELYKKTNAKGVLIDESYFGKVLIDELRYNYLVPADGWRFTPSERNTLIDNLRKLFDNSQIIIPRKNVGLTLQLTDELIKELTKVVASETKTGLKTYKSLSLHNDMLMSLALACYSASKSINVKKVTIKSI